METNKNSGLSKASNSTAGYSIGGVKPPAACEPHDDIKPGTKIGKYKVIDGLESGGLGEVFEAEHHEISTRFAIKILRADKVNAGLVERFELERKVLGRLKHDHIVRITDSGQYRGRPYFVMELIDGSPITEYADSHRLNIQERLKLFLQVCQAVKAAHKMGFIHRDIKPTNVLVNENSNGEPQAKVIDFGIAKIVNNGLPLAYATKSGHLLGTPAYMSPEQTGDDPKAINEGTDIYLLGLLLYELLVGKQPLAINGSEKEDLRPISEQTPLPPSKRINEKDDESFFQVAQKRGVDPAQLEKLLKGDLDRIAMKCLAKKPQDRFDSVEQLALELKTHCNKSIQGEGAPAIAPIIAEGKTWFRWSFASVVILIGLIAGWMIFHSGQMKIHAPDAAHGEAAKRMYWMLQALKSHNKDISDAEAYLTPNAKQFWQWLLAQEWFAKKPLPRITGYEGDEAHPVVNIVFEYPAGIDHGNETMSVKFLRDNGVIKLDEVSLMEMKGARFDGMPLSLVVTNRAEADAKFAMLNPQLKGVDFMQLAKQ